MRRRGPTCATAGPWPARTPMDVKELPSGPIVLAVDTPGVSLSDVKVQVEEGNVRPSKDGGPIGPIRSTVPETCWLLSLLGFFGCLELINTRCFTLALPLPWQFVCILMLENQESHTPAFCPGSKLASSSHS